MLSYNISYDILRDHYMLKQGDEDNMFIITCLIILIFIVMIIIVRISFIIFVIKYHYEGDEEPRLTMICIMKITTLI